MSRVTTYTLNATGDDVITLDAATETDALGAADVGIDVSQTDGVVVVIKALDADIETVTLYRSVLPDGGTFAAHGENLGPVTGGGDPLILDILQPFCHRLRLTCTSATGTEVEVQAWGFKDTL